MDGLKQYSEEVNHMLKRYSLLISFLVFIAIHTTILSVVPHETTCGDGTYSSSIGKRGACSYHGGVKRTSVPVLSFFISLGLAIFVKFKLEEVPKPPKRKDVPSKTKPYKETEREVLIFPQREEDTSKFKGYDNVIVSWVESFGIDWTVRHLQDKGLNVSKGDINTFLGLPEDKADKKKCIKCEVGQSPQGFYKSKKNADGLTKWCRSCLKSHNNKKGK